MPDLILHNFARSTASFRVRIALNLKGLDYAYRSYRLREDEHRTDAYLALTEYGLVPSLELPDGQVIGQSLAIMEYLEETWPEPRLLPADPLRRARVREIALAVACEIHPLNNLRVLNELRSRFGADGEALRDWARHWIGLTLAPIEHDLVTSPHTGTFCDGDAPGLADICLFAQHANNRRFGVDITPYPTVNRVLDACASVAAFERARPENQPDADAP